MLIVSVKRRAAPGIVVKQRGNKIRRAVGLLASRIGRNRLDLRIVDRHDRYRIGGAKEGERGEEIV